MPPLARGCGKVTGTLSLTLDLLAVPLLEAGDPTAVSSLCFFQVWGQILTAIACPLPSLLPPSPPSPLPPMPAGRWHPLAPRSLTASSMPPSLT